MKETTQKEIIALAKKHTESNYGIHITLISYNEAKVKATNAVNAIGSHVGIIHSALTDKVEYRVCYDNTDIVAQSHKLASALSEMNVCLANLAAMLQNLGEEILY